MTRAPHICTCGKIVAYGITCQCKVAAIRARNRRHDATRPSARQRGYDTKWDKARAEWLAYNPACTRCRAPATVVDHITPHKGDKDVFWDKTNWQSLCSSCHDRHKQREERRS